MADRLSATIRPAEPADIGELMRLNAQVQSQHAQLEPTHFKGAPDAAVIQQFFELLLKAKDNRIIVAEKDGALQGYIWLQIQKRPEGPFTYARDLVYIHHIVVDEAIRRQGLATALFAKVESEAAGAGILHIMLDTWATNSAAQGFFASLGFTPRNLVLQRSLAAPE